MAMKYYDEWCKENCPYHQDCYDAGVCNYVQSLLKEQGSVSPTWEQGKAYCGKCGHRLPRKRADREINYCGYCGRALKWK